MIQPNKKEINTVATGVLGELGIDKSMDELLDDFNTTPKRIQYLYYYCKYLEVLIKSQKIDISIIDEQNKNTMNRLSGYLKKNSGLWKVG